MTQIRVVRYTTTPEARDENAELVSRVYAALAETQPDGLRYATLLLAEENAFVHLAIHDGEDNPLTRLPAFIDFQRGLGTRVVAAPGTGFADVVGSYRLL